MRILPFVAAFICVTVNSFIVKGQSESIEFWEDRQIFFRDNGQIKSKDDAHRIRFRRSENILELMEFGSIMFSPGAQNSQSTAKMHLTSDGFLGIGTTAPSSPLTVSTGTQVISMFRNTGNGNTNIAVANNNGQLSLGIGALTPHPYIWSTTGKFFIGDDGNPTVYVDKMGNGNVGIGCTDTKGHKLAVAGTAIFTKVTVKALTVPFPDYVFHANYRLRPLSEVEAYIKQHQHLPEVPSAEEVEKNGLDVGDNQAALLKKIEELTLYVIEQNKRIEALEKERSAEKKKRKRAE